MVVSDGWKQVEDDDIYTRIVKEERGPPTSIDDLIFNYHTNRPSIIQEFFHKQLLKVKRKKKIIFFPNIYIFVGV